MSDWLLTTLPIAVAIYFLLNPAQLTSVLDMLGTFLH
jgi:hypothetical protein